MPPSQRALIRAVAPRTSAQTHLVFMTTREEPPNEATEEPQILSPQQEAERGEAAETLSERLEHEGDPLSLAAADNPLRMPGEMAARARTAAWLSRHAHTPSS